MDSVRFVPPPPHLAVDERLDDGRDEEALGDELKRGEARGAEEEDLEGHARPPAPAVRGRVGGDVLGPGAVRVVQRGLEQVGHLHHLRRLAAVDEDDQVRDEERLAALVEEDLAPPGGRDEKAFVSLRLIPCHQSSARGHTTSLAGPIPMVGGRSTACSISLAQGRGWSSEAM